MVKRGRRHQEGSCTRIMGEPLLPKSLPRWTWGSARLFGSPWSAFHLTFITEDSCKRPSLNSWNTLLKSCREDERVSQKPGGWPDQNSTNQIKNIRLIHLDSCSVCSSQTAFYCWQPSCVDFSINIYQLPHHAQFKKSTPLFLLLMFQLFLTISYISFHLPYWLPLSFSSPCTAASWSFMSQWFHLNMQGCKFQRAIPSLFSKSMSTCVNSSTARVMWAGQG